MEEDHKTIKDELGSLKKKIEGYSDGAEKRTTLVLTLCSIIVAALAAFIIGLSIYNYASLDSFKKDTKERIDEWIGKKKGQPRLSLITGDSKPLEGATIEEETITTIPPLPKGKIGIRVHLYVQNDGDALASTIYVKFYLRPPMNTGSNSFEEREKGFKYETGPIKFDSDLPPKISRVVFVNLIFDSFELPKKQLPMLVKVWYGEQAEQLVKAKFFINILK